jgi:hypothetical protein
MTVPKTAGLELSGAVTELLAYGNHKDVLPVYYDVILTSKIARDDESLEMLEIIYSGACYEFSLNLYRIQGNV